MAVGEVQVEHAGGEFGDFGESGAGGGLEIVLLTVSVGEAWGPVDQKYFCLYVHDEANLICRKAPHRIGWRSEVE